MQDFNGFVLVQVKWVCRPVTILSIEARQNAEVVYVYQATVARPRSCSYFKESPTWGWFGRTPLNCSRSEVTMSLSNEQTQRRAFSLSPLYRRHMTLS